MTGPAGTLGVVDAPNVTAQRWAEWAATATTDIVPDYYRGETLPDGTVAEQAMWVHADDSIRPEPPDGD